MRMLAISPRYHCKLLKLHCYASASNARNRLASLRISKDLSCHVGDLQVQWNRAARTDKGVSAAGNVVSLKMMIGFPDLVERINAELPSQVPIPRNTNFLNPILLFSCPLAALCTERHSPLLHR